VSRASTDELILAIDQGTTNSKAALISVDGRVVSDGSAPVGISSRTLTGSSKTQTVCGRACWKLWRAA
jgi:glycerol kinase